MRNLITMVLLLGSCAVVSAQIVEKTRAFGIVNGYATELPKPILTIREKAVCASGQVKVEVLIGIRGRVIYARAVSGEKVLRRSAVAAAKRARFSPINDLPPIKMRGYLVYYFQLPGHCDSSKEKVISICNINAKVISLPAPDYPAAALMVNVTGSVEVQIEVDENGKVIAAKAISGHPLLRSASEKAAMAAKFEPVAISNKPIKVLGVITYNFVK